MSADSIAVLLEKLCRGDTEAAQRVFLTYEPYLRMVVRRQLSPSLRAQFDSMDIVQSIWADLLSGFRKGTWHFDDPAHLQAFLVKVTRNRFLNHAQRHQNARQHSARIADGNPRTREPRPSEVAQGVELWEQMLALCPAAHRQILHLKRQGLPLAEIARQTGFHPSSIRRILYDLARRLACRSGKKTPSPGDGC